MWTVTALARSCGLSRTTVLYYESIGLLRPAARSRNNYRRYAAADAERLRRICAFREAGLKLSDIRALLDGPGEGAGAVLRRRFLEIDAEIRVLREHQRSIARLLHVENSMETNDMITKDKWVAILRSSGFSDGDMHRWHTEFEKAAPEEHQEFLQFLHIPDDEIRKIREWSRGGAESR